MTKTLPALPSAKDSFWTPEREALELRASRMRQADNRSPGGFKYSRRVVEVTEEIANEIGPQGQRDSAPALYEEK